jgi:hypothetical protein
MGNVAAAGREFCFVRCAESVRVLKMSELRMREDAFMSALARFVMVHVIEWRDE